MPLLRWSSWVQGAFEWRDLITSYNGNSYSSYSQICTCSFAQLIKRAGTPSLSGFRPWLQRASSSTEFFYLITTITLQSNPAAWIGLIPMAILAVYHVSAFLNSTLGHTELWRSTGAAAGHAWLAANKEAALQASAILEVATAFQLLLSVLQTGPRALFSTYMYANQLRGRRWSPESSKYHAQAWSELGRRAAPLLRHVPILQRLVAGGQRWFQQGQRTAA